MIDEKKEHKKRNCLFCHWVDILYDKQRKLQEEEKKEKKELEKRMIKKDENWFAVLDEAPKTLGHALVISRYPFDDFTDEIIAPDKTFSQERKEELFNAAIEIAKNIKDLFLERKDEGKIYLLTICEHWEMWESSRGTTEHLHFHLIPRHPSMNIKAESLISKEGKKQDIETLKRIADLLKKDSI